MSHEDDCTTPLAFPAPIANRPALPRIAYRIGDYASVREALLRWRDLAPELAAWTHRGAGDPGVALLEGAAVLTDVLALYQEVYANECFLRTAQWRDSIAALVELTGYRLAPAVGGRAVLAASVTGDAPVAIPAGFAITAPLAAGGPPVTLETTAAVTAHPWLDEVPLHALGARPAFTSASRTLALPADAVLRRGDRLFVANAADRIAWPCATVIVEAVRPVLDELHVDVRGTLPALLGVGFTRLTAWRTGRAMHHFGHNAPRQWTQPSGDLATTTFERRADRAVTLDDPSLPALDANELPLDTRLDAPPAHVLCAIEVSGGIFGYPRRVTGAQNRGVAWGPLAATVTVLELEPEPDGTTVFLEPSLGFSSPGPLTYDLRGVEVLEVLGGPWTVTAPPARPADGASGRIVAALGTAAEVELLRDRPLLLAPADGGEPLPLRATPLDVRDPDVRRLREVELDQPIALAALAWDAPAARVLGNLVEATEGATQSEVKLGNGDARRAWQQLRLPKAPLTYLTDPAAGRAPELTLLVDGKRWRRVESLAAAGPDDEVYVVREDDRGSYVQAGDGVTGRRFPSGLGNIAARYRTGAGSSGPLRTGASARAVRRLPGLDRFALPGVVAGGAPAESAAVARRAAPARLQSLGRLVSLADYEAEALALPGVEDAAARWDEVGGVASIVVTILMASGRDAEADAVRAALLAAERARGPRRHPIVVERGAATAAAVGLLAAIDAGAVRASIEEALRGALVTGVFGEARRFGEPEYAARVLGVAQQVAGVRWVELHAFGPAGATAVQPVLGCAPDRVLRLDPAALALSFVEVP